MRETRICCILPIGLFLMMGLFGGCGSSGGPIVRRDFVPFTSDQRREIAAHETREYQIQPGDLLRVVFASLKELNQDHVLVLDDGSINLTSIDRVVVSGMTLTEADSLITGLYSRDYVDPVLSVIVIESRERQIYVMGEVRNPGLHRVPPGGLNLVSAIAVAGGFSADAAKGGVVVVRVDETGYLVQEVDLSNFVKSQSSEVAFVGLDPYDIVYVPRSRIGDFSYFSKTILSGLVSISRVASDVRYLATRDRGF